MLVPVLQLISQFRNEVVSIGEVHVGGITEWLCATKRLVDSSIVHATVLCQTGTG